MCRAQWVRAPSTKVSHTTFISASNSAHPNPRPLSCPCHVERTFSNLCASSLYPPLPTPRMFLLPSLADPGRVWAGWELAHMPPLPLCVPPGMIIKRKLQKT